MPDTATAPTALYPMVSDVTVTSNVNGDAAVGFHPSLTYDACSCVVTAGNLAASWTTTAHPSLSTLTASAVKFRMTGWRITVRYTGPESTCSGSMFIAPSSGFTASMISSGMSTYTPQMKQYNLNPSGTWTFYVPMLGAPDFGSSGTGNSVDFWAGMVMFFRGMPASSGVISVRSERSIEYMPEPVSAGLVDTSPEPYDPVGYAEAGIFAGTAQGSENDAGPGWASRLGAATYNLVRGVGAGAVNAAREDVRGHLGRNHLRLMDL